MPWAAAVQVSSFLWLHGCKTFLQRQSRDKFRYPSYLGSFRVSYLKLFFNPFSNSTFDKWTVWHRWVQLKNTVYSPFVCVVKGPSHLIECTSCSFRCGCMWFRCWNYYLHMLIVCKIGFVSLVFRCWSECLRGYKLFSWDSICIVGIVPNSSFIIWISFICK